MKSNDSQRAPVEKSEANNVPNTVWSAPINEKNMYNLKTSSFMGKQTRD